MMSVFIAFGQIVAVTNHLIGILYRTEAEALGEQNLKQR